ncbi:MAG: polyprenyl synthetase family protein [Clostridia bacterium]|nr:polyprenyl synthetase family protein [Clostridia bacterium]
MGFAEDTREYREIIEEALSAYIAACGAPRQLREAMEYSLNAGGKRLRPVLALFTCDMLGGDVRRALPFACALEMIHTYSLIHDDLPCMDDDDFRRGRPSNHRVFGEANAVLAGDGLLSYAFEIMIDAVKADVSENTINAAAAVALGAGVKGMVAGQAIDLASETADDPGIDELRFIQANKTAAMIKASILAGAHIAGASEEQLAALGRYGEAYGALFQMTDDILDVEGDFEGMGKTLGKDEAENKLTYISLYGMSRAKELAEETARQAVDAIEIFGERAALLRELAKSCIHRRS